MSLSGSSNYLDITATSLPNLSGSTPTRSACGLRLPLRVGEYLYKGDGGWNLNDQAFFLTGTAGGGASSGFIPGGVEYAGGFAGGNTAITSGNWSFITIVRSGGMSTFYVNGVATGTATTMDNPEQGTQDIRIGGLFDTFASDGVTAFNGSISGTYVYGMH